MLPTAQAVDGRGYQFFPHTALAFKQDRDIYRRHLPDTLNDSPKRWCVAEQPESFL